MGHSGAVHLGTYAHVIEALGTTRYADLDALIQAARTGPVFRQSSASAAE